ncbi:MAG: GAF domain-containing protein [Candidatus Promineifilaceae bacterium]
MLIQTLIENVTDSIFVIDDDAHFVEVNESARKFLGRSWGDLIGEPAWKVLTELGRQQFDEYWEQLHAQGTLEGRAQVALVDGRVLPVEFKAIANVSPGRHLVIFRDASDLKRVEAQTQAFLKLGWQLSAATTAKEAARIITGVADELLKWDACFLDLYQAETDTVDPLLAIDIVDGKRQDVAPSHSGAPSPVGRRILEEGKQLILEGGDDPDLGLVPFGDIERPSVSLMFVPVRNRTEVIGIFSIQSYRPNAYDQDDLDTLQALADFGGGALHRIRGEALLARSKNRLVALREIEQAILEARSSEEIARVALDRIEDIIPYDRGSVVLFNTADWSGRLLAAVGLGSEYSPEARLKLQDFSKDVVEDLRLGKYYLVGDISAQKSSSAITTQMMKLGLKAVIGVPLLVGNTLFGVLNLASLSAQAFDKEDADVATEVAISLAVALQNAELLLEAKEQANKFSELVDETRRRAEQMEVMVNISSAMRHIQSRQELIPVILDRLMALSGAAGAAIALRTGDYLEFELSLGQWPQLADVHFPADEGVTGNVLTTGQPFVTADLGSESEFYALRVFDEIFAAICVPLGIEESSLGVLWLVRHEPFSADEQRVMVAVADIVANALRRTFLYERVQEQARQVQQIVDTIPEGMLLLSEERAIVLANPVAQTYLTQLAGVSIGDTLEELCGQPLGDLLRPIVAGENWHELVVEKTGQVFELAVQKTYGRLEGGWVLVLRDVTEERNQARYFQIQERLAVVGQLAAGIAHDFNNIMSVVILYSTMLRHSSNLSEKEKERLMVIHKQAERASELIRQILDFSRQSVMKRSVLNLVPFLKELVHLLERTLPETIRLQLDADPGDLIIQGDPTRLQQAIMNLAVNARDAMPEGGTLKISLRTKEVRPKEVPPLPDMAPGAWFELKIEDSGTGIEPHHLPHLFEPFFTTKREGEGTGLGLAQVYGIVKQHDGYIDVSSRLRQGTTFYIYLPGVQMPKVEDVVPEAVPLPEGMGHTILVVEDDNGARQALAEVLQMMDYQVVTAVNGREALKYYDEAHGNVDLVLSDVVMPVMGGAALYAQLKKRKSDIKMVVMTGYPQKDEDWKLLEEGGVHWVQKPFQVATIVETIKQVLVGAGEEQN